MGNPGSAKWTARPAFAHVLRYGLAVSSVAAVIGTTLIQHHYNSLPRFISHYTLVAIAITFWYAGTVPGLLAFFLSCLGTSLLARYHYLATDFPLESFVILYAMFSLLVGWFSSARRRAERLLMEARDNLEIRVAERTGDLVRTNDELQDTQAELVESKARLEEAERVAHLGYWEWDLVTDRVVWSDETYRIHGLRPQERPMDLAAIREFIHPEDRDFVFRRAEGAIRGGGRPDLEHRIVRSSGEVRILHSQGDVKRDASGRPCQMFGSTQDITERKRAEEDRKQAEQLLANLAHIGRVSTMGELVASISHELAQPIQITTAHAKASLRWLQRDPPEVTEARKGTERIIEAGALASEIINRLRSLYKKAPPKRELVAINDVVGEMAGMMRDEARGHGVSIGTDLNDDLPLTMVDRVQVQQVLMNLMLNGIEAMKDTGGVLTVKSQLGEDGQIQLSINDAGPGLPLGKVDQIFDAFFTTKPQGSGMGLAISKSIVESQGGRIWANGEGGRGATFHFTLPIVTPSSTDIREGA